MSQKYTETRPLIVLEPCEDGTYSLHFTRSYKLISGNLRKRTDWLPETKKKGIAAENVMEAMVEWQKWLDDEHDRAMGKKK